MQFEPDEEQQEGDADFGKGEFRFAAAYQPQPVRTDQRAGDQIAQHRAETEAAEQQDKQRRDPEQDRAFDQRRVGGLSGGGFGRGGGQREQAHTRAPCFSSAVIAASNGSRIAPCRAG